MKMTITNRQAGWALVAFRDAMALTLTERGDPNGLKDRKMADWQHLINVFDDADQIEIKD